MTSPNLDKLDLKILAQASLYASPHTICRRYIKNYHKMDERNQRRVVGQVQAKRAMAAKTVFLKELAAVGAQLKA